MGSVVNAQDWNWVVEPVNGTATPKDVSGQGSKAICGYFSGTTVFGSNTLTAVGGTDAFLVKMLNSGISWTVKAGGTANEEFSKVVYIGSSIYVAGTRTGGSTTFYSTNATTMTLASGAGSCFLAKYSITGVIQWVTGFSGTIEDMTVDVGSQKIYVTGMHDPSVYKMSTKCFDFSGSSLWTIQSTNGVSSYAAGKGVGADTTGCYVLSEITGNISFPSSITYTTSGQDLLITKFDVNGNFVWGKRIGGVLPAVNEFGKDLDLDNNGNIFITGRYFGGTTSMDASNTYTFSSGGGIDMYVAKYDNVGNILWANAIKGAGDDIPLGMALYPNGSCALIVQNKGYNSVTLGPGLCNTFTSTDNTASDNKWYTVTYKSDGVFDWAAAPSTNKTLALPGGIACDNSSVQIAGLKYGETEFGSYSFIDFSYSMFIARVAKGICPAKPANIVGVFEQSNSSDAFNVFPNPSTGIVTITANEFAEGVIDVYDITGKKVKSIHVHENLADYKMDLSTYSKGVYMLNFISNGKTTSKKIVLE